MRTISRVTQFKKDYKRESTGKFPTSLDSLLIPILTLLAADIALPPSLRDHALTGQWRDHRDCHIRPDLVLIYRLPDPDTLQLVRLGSHSELNL